MQDKLTEPAEARALVSKSVKHDAVINLGGVAAAMEVFGRARACHRENVHAESLWVQKEEKEEDKNPIPCPQCVITRPVMPPKEGKPGTAIDVTAWDPDEGRLYIFRFGNGKDCVLELA